VHYLANKVFDFNVVLFHSMKSEKKVSDHKMTKCGRQEVVKHL